jgi:hypothetical protein
MGEQRVLERPRYIAVFVVFGLHFALVTALIIASRIRRLSPAAENVMTTLVLLPTELAPKAGAGSAPTRHPTKSAPLVPVTPFVISPPPISDPPDAPAPIDWAAEA